MSETLGSRLLYARELTGISSRELDRLAGTTEGHASMIERGERPRIEVATADKMAIVLGLSLDWLVRGAGRRPTKRHVVAAVEQAREVAA